VRWEGTAVSADNPFALRMDRNHVLAARFRVRDYLETFESGTLEALPWRTEGEAAWSATRATASTGLWSARSGAVGNGGTSVLRLERETGAGGGSFDYRTESEAGWDYLEFRVNGELRERWSGVSGWQTYVFNVPAGRNRFEWSFARDRTFGGTQDAVWIDNLDLPEVESAVRTPRLRWAGSAGECRIEVEGTVGVRHVLEASEDLKRWEIVGTAVLGASPMAMTDGDCGTRKARFYRVRTEP